MLLEIANQRFAKHPLVVCEAIAWVNFAQVLRKSEYILINKYFILIKNAPLWIVLKLNMNLFINQSSIASLH